MYSPVALRPDQLRLVQLILRSHIPDREVRAFGLRVSGKYKAAPDLDLCIMGTDRLPADALDGLRLAFNESALPIRVDVVEWAALNSTFRAIIDRQSAMIQSPL